MKQLNFSKDTPQGEIKGSLKVDKKYLYFKFNNSQYAQQAITQMSQKGAVITQGNGWIKVDLIRNMPVVKLGDIIINQKEDSSEEVEEKLFQFYTVSYAKMGFTLK